MIYLFIWVHGEDNLKDFKNDFNNFKSNLKFPFEFNRNSINFLDINGKLDNGELTTNEELTTSIDRHKNFHYSSSHAEHIKRSIVNSQVLRASCLCSFKEDFLDHCEKMKTLFSKRNYLTGSLKMKWKKLILLKVEVKPNLPQKWLSLLHITPDSRP